MIRSMFVAGLLCVLAGTAGVAKADCTADVERSFSKLRDHKGFRVEMTIIDERQGNYAMTIDYLLPDRMHQRILQGNSPAMETIAIGERVWSKQKTGWSEVDASIAEVVTRQFKEQVTDPTHDLTYECLGETTFEGKEFIAYEARMMPGPRHRTKVGLRRPDTPRIQTFYVDKATGLPVRNIVTRADASKKRVFDGTFSTPSDIAIDAPG